MEPTTVLKIIFQAASKIYDIAKEIKANKHRCQRKCFFYRTKKNVCKIYWVHVDRGEFSFSNKSTTNVYSRRNIPRPLMWMDEENPSFIAEE
jgi:hypothetical protein